MEKEKNFCAAASTYQNPLMEGADPFILAHDGTYYLYATNAEEGFRVFHSRDLISWQDGGYCLRREDVMGEKWFWAPEVLAYRGKFYMVYVAEEHLAVAVADHPLGPFRQEHKRWLSERNAIDGHFFADDDGTVYLYYVRFDNGNVIYAAKMSEDLSTLDEANEQCLFRAEEEWETRDGSVAEGPFVLKKDGVYYLTYSANNTSSPDYAVGLAASFSPLGPFTKYGGNPILQKTEQVCGVGHHSFFRSLRDGELICVYHCHCSKTEFQPRKVCLDRAEFVAENGCTVLKIHGPTHTPQKAIK